MTLSAGWKGVVSWTSNAKDTPPTALDLYTTSYICCVCTGHVYPAIHLRCGWCWRRTANLQPSRSARSRFPSTSLVRLEGGASPRRLLKASPSTEALNFDQKKKSTLRRISNAGTAPPLLLGLGGLPLPPWCVKPRFRHKSFLKFFRDP